MEVLKKMLAPCSLQYLLISLISHSLLFQNQASPGTLTSLEHPPLPNHRRFIPSVVFTYSALLDQPSAACFPSLATTALIPSLSVSEVRTFVFCMYVWFLICQIKMVTQGAQGPHSPGIW